MVRTATNIGRDCTSEVNGVSLQNAVSSGGCDQVVRATYLSAKQGEMGTIGVLNLTSAAAAKAAATTAGSGSFIAQLAARRGPTSRIGQGQGIEQALAKGHYLILIWAEYTSLHKPKTTAQRNDLAQFVTELVDNTANVSLTSRMLNGTP